VEGQLVETFPELPIWGELEIGRGKINRIEGLVNLAWLQYFRRFPESPVCHWMEWRQRLSNMSLHNGSHDYRFDFPVIPVT
jgi:hypothetical protein